MPERADSDPNPQTAGPAPGQPGWHVVYTKPRQARLAEQNLLRQRDETWLSTIGKWMRLAPLRATLGAEHPLRPGARVRVVAGPFAGLQALVTASAARRVEIFLSLLSPDARVSVRREQQPEPLPA